MSTQQDKQPMLPFRDFQQAAVMVLEMLQAKVGLGLWLVTRTEGDDWIVLSAADQRYGVKNGDVLRWSDSFCYRMVHGRGPRVAPDATQVEAYKEAPISRQMPIGAYIGVPLARANGSLFGTLCAIDPDPQPQSLVSHLPSVELNARLLATILDAELERQEQTRRIEQAEAEAEIDPLTRVYNRRGWKRLLRAEENRCRRYGSQAGVVVIDLDDLKQINDSLGHAAGDRVLERTADVLRAIVRQTDIVARLGGDEFVVLAPEEDAVGLDQFEKRLVDALLKAGVRASVGSACRDPRSDLESAQELADQRMYEQKKQAGGPGLTE